MGVNTSSPSTIASKSLSRVLNCNTDQMLIFVGSVKVRKSLYIHVIIWVNTVLIQIDTRKVWSRYESSYMASIYLSKWNQKQQKNLSNAYTLLASNMTSFFINTHMISNEDFTNLTMARTKPNPYLLNNTKLFNIQRGERELLHTNVSHIHPT